MDPYLDFGNEMPSELSPRQTFLDPVKKFYSREKSEPQYFPPFAPCRLCPVLGSALLPIYALS